jgi:hypothetical protein
MVGVVNRIIVVITVLVFMACSKEMGDSSFDYAELISTFDFESVDQLWDGGISDYPLDYPDSADYVVANQLLLANTASVYSGNGLSITAENPHGDLFYYFKKKISGFKKNTNYKLDFEFLAFSKLSSGIAIPSNENAYLKVGAVSFEPKLHIQKWNDDQEYMTLNIDKGSFNESSGKDMISLGSIKEFTSNQPEAISGNTFDIEMEVKSDADGSIWLVIGVDSGIKSQLTFSLAAITVYYREILG